MTTLGLIGSGHIGSTVAKLAVDAGHDVVLGNSRGPDTLAGLVAELGPRARVADGKEAAAAGELDEASLTNSEYLARNVPGAVVVKVFNNIFFKHLLNLPRPVGAPD